MGRKTKPTIAHKPRTTVASSRRVRGLSASFDSAQTTTNNSRYWKYADALSADAAINPDVRQTLRQRSRYEVQNNCHAKGLVDLIANDTIGTGPRLQMLLDDEELNDRLEKDFRKWSDEVKLPQKLQLLRKERCQNGEAFCMISTNPMLRSPIKLNPVTIEADRIKGETLPVSSSQDIDGIRYDKWGNPVSYRLLKYHPNEVTIGASDDAEYIDAKYMLHTFIQIRSGQHRGVPELTPALEPFAMLRRYGYAELSAAEAAADFAAVLYTDTPAGGESESLEPFETVPLERNMMVSLPDGWKLGQMDSRHPSANHPQFVKVNLAAVARSVCATYGSISGDFSGFNYASGRLDNQIYHKSIIVDRMNWERDIINPIFSMWVREWCLLNGVDFFDETEHIWFWEGFEHVDPQKNANAHKTELETLQTSLADIYAEKGQDYRQAAKKIGQVIKVFTENGIPLQVLFPQLAANTSQNGSAAQDGDDEPED